jgi:squalene-associated FAD-dependent desaturase
MGKTGGGGAGVFMTAVHVVGAGLAGLAAACILVESGREVVLHDAAKAAGGRARSYKDKTLNAVIDNGNHLLLSGNTAAMVYLRRIGSAQSLIGPAQAIFPFANSATGARWTIRLNDGRTPWWIFDRNRRVPGTKFLDYLPLLKLRKAGADDLVAPLLGGGREVYKNFLEPVAIAALNTMPEEASAAPLRAVFAETVERGGLSCIPRYPAVGLSETFIDPALDWLRERGVQIRLGRRVTSIDPTVPTVLAVPPWVAAKFLPDLPVPDAFESICNLHFKYRLDPGEAGFWGLVGGMAEWVFAKGEILSVTVSAANRYAEMDPDEIATKIWGELALVFGLPETMPVHRLVWEKRATFSCAPAQLAKRPPARTANPNLVIAGDWTDTGLPASIEGAIRSGNAAALALLHR